MPESAAHAAHLLQTLPVALFIYFVPGYALYVWIWDGAPQDWVTKAGLSSSLSIGIYPLLFLAFYILGMQPGAAVAWGVPILGLLAIAWRYWRYSASAPCVSADRQPDSHLFGALVAVVFVALILTRLLPVQAMVAPAWGDSVHHTVITQLIRDNHGLFQSWSPYSPMTSFTYHFGFHVNAAVWSWITQATVPESVIVSGQVMNILAVLALYPISARLSGNRWAGLGAMLIAGMMTLTPSTYVNWGRYTQLTAQVILPALLWFTDVWYAERTRPSRRILILFILLVTGLALSHYRVTAIAVSAVLAFSLWGLWLWRRTLNEFAIRLAWITGAAVAALALVSPWLTTVAQGRIYSLAARLASRAPGNPRLHADLSLWTTIGEYYHPLLLVFALSGLVIAMRLRPRLGIPLALWCVLGFLITNPYLVNLPGTGVTTNFLVLVGLYIPIAILSGYLLGLLWQALLIRPYGIIAVGATILAMTLASFPRQFSVVDPSWQMVTKADTMVLQWVRHNTDLDSVFAVNGFLAFNDTTVVGSDAGWWLQYYAVRDSTVPPVLYTTERLRAGRDREWYRDFVLEIRDSRGLPTALRATLCEYGITHVYLGDRQGSVGFGETQLIPPAWLQDNTDFRLLHQTGDAQVWAFDRNPCAATP